MEAVVLVIHLMLALAIIALVLLQQSEGGGLGIGGGGGGMGGLATARTTANVMTKLTTIFAICFMITSLTLAILAKKHVEAEPTSILDMANDPEVTVPVARDGETTVPAMMDKDILKGEDGVVDIKKAVDSAPVPPTPKAETEPSVPLSE